MNLRRLKMTNNNENNSKMKMPVVGRRYRLNYSNDKDIVEIKQIKIYVDFEYTKGGFTQRNQRWYESDFEEFLESEQEKSLRLEKEYEENRSKDTPYSKAFRYQVIKYFEQKDLKNSQKPRKKCQ